MGNKEYEILLKTLKEELEKYFSDEENIILFEEWKAENESKSA